MSQTKIEPRLFSSGAECLNAFYDGKLDMAFMGSAPFIMGRAADVPIQILSLANRTKGGEAVLLRGSLDPEQVTTQRLHFGTVYGSSGHYLLKSYQRAHPSLRIETLFMPPELQLDAFRNGFVDGISVWEPYVGYAREHLTANVIYDASSLPAGGVLNFLVVREGFLQDHPQIAVRFLNALRDNSEWIVENKEEAESLLGQIINSPDVTNYPLGCPDLKKYDWEVIPADKLERTGMVEKLGAIAEMLAAEHIVPPLEPRHRKMIFAAMPQDPPLPLHPEEKNVLRIGHATDMMCASFLIAGAMRFWPKRGFYIEPHTQLVAERVIHYDLRTQNTIMEIFGNIGKGKTLQTDVTSLRTVLERCVRWQCERYGVDTKGTDGRVLTLNSLVDRLRKKFKKLLPDELHSYCHIIRDSGNDTAHGNVSHAPELRLLLELTMRFLDWCFSDGSGQCPNPDCRTAIRLEWRYCTHCSQPLFNERPKCPLSATEIMDLLEIEPGPLVGMAQRMLDEHPGIVQDEAKDLLLQWHREQRQGETTQD